MLPFGPLGPGTVHVAVDLQRIFAEDTAWQCTAIPSILPNVLRLAHAKPGRTVWTRFVVPHHADDAPGMWRDYYRHWEQFTGRVMEPGLVDLVPDLVAHADSELVIDKLTYSAFEVPAFAELLDRLGADTLLFTGVETDVCVLGTLLPAIDRGYRVVAVSDALASSSEAGHRATLDAVLPRFDRQVEIATTDDVLKAWQG
jgi:nicotinamidase-related amidase